ncbi:hypothetical protein MMC07_002997 [Pseudocyphellaria aurata]|nr:hypothetical protein [Pseudocyphellaria aurata]
MPPKAQPRRQQPPRGTVRPRAAGEPANTPAPDESRRLDEEQPAAPLDSEAADLTEKSVPQDVAQISSPASTAAATVGAVPRRRLASLHSRKSTSLSATPEASDGRSTGLKYQPRSNARRTKAEREAFEKAEVERRRSRLAEVDVPLTFSSDRGGYRGRGGRGLHGGGMHRFTSGEASGHLGGSSVPDGGKKKKNARGGGLFAGLSIPLAATSTTAGHSALKKETKVKPEREKDGDVLMGTDTSRRRQIIKEEERGPTYISSDEEPDLTEGPRVNIEHINLLSDGDTDGEKPKAVNQDQGKEVDMEAKLPSWSLKPIRIDRHEHVERVIGVNTDASSLTSAELRRRAKEKGDAEGSLFLPDEDEPEILRTVKAKGKSKLKDVEFVRDERRWKGVYQDDEDNDLEVAIKSEPRDDDDLMDIDDVADASISAPHLATLSEAVAPEIVATETLENAKAKEAALLLEKKISQRPKSRLNKPVLQTEEDRNEWARYEEDLHILGEELGSAFAEAPPRQTLNSDGFSQPGKHLPTDTKDNREGLVYLFQLPPIMPRTLTREEKDSILNSKHEEKMDEHHRQDKKPGDKKLPGSDVKVKSETKEFIHSDTTNANAFMAQDSTRPLGRVGKLRVYDSGRVMATWGGARLEVGRGGEGGLLQEVVMTDYERTLVKVEEGKEKGKERWEERISLGEKGWAVGQLGGGFVLVPDWGRMLGL